MIRPCTESSRAASNGTEAYSRAPEKEYLKLYIYINIGIHSTAGRDLKKLIMPVIAKAGHLPRKLRLGV